jgi:hypothetical protein
MAVSLFLFITLGGTLGNPRENHERHEDGNA